MIADTRAQFGAIERNLTEIKDAAPQASQAGSQPAAIPARIAPAHRRGDQGLEGAPA